MRRSGFSNPLPRKGVVAVQPCQAVLVLTSIVSLLAAFESHQLSIVLLQPNPLVKNLA